MLASLKYLNLNKILGGLLVFLVAFSLYTYSACRTNPGYADSDELITTGYLLSLPHPPGYPVYTFLTHGFLSLPLPGNVAFRANVFSGFLHSLTLIFLYLIILKLIRLLSSTEENEDEFPFQIIVAAGGALVLGFSALFWLYSSVAEVFALNDLLVALTVWLLLKWYETDHPAWLVGSSVFVGLGLSHLQTFVLFLPAIILLYIIKQGKESLQSHNIIKALLLSLVSFVVFIGSYLFLFVLNNRNQTFMWPFKSTFNGWIGHVLRSDFSGVIAERGVEVNSYISGFDLPRYAEAFPKYWLFINSHFSGIGIVLGLIGIIWLIIKSEKLASFILSLFLFGGLGLGLYMGIPKYDPNDLDYRFNLGILQRHYLQGEVIWAVFIALGVWALADVAKRKISLVTLKRISAAGIVVFISYLSWLALTNYSIGVQRGNVLAHDYAKAVLNEAPEDGIIIASTDFSYFSLKYLQEVEGYKKDVAILSRAPRYNEALFRKKANLFPGLHYLNPADYYANIIAWNVQDHRVYLTEITDYYDQYMGLSGNPYYVIPRGQLFEVSKDYPVDLTVNTQESSLLVEKTKTAGKDFLMQNKKDYFAFLGSRRAGLLFGYGKKAEALALIKITKDLNTDSPELKNYFSRINLQNLDYKLDDIPVSTRSGQLIVAANTATAQKNNEAAIQIVRRLTFLEPKNLDYRISLAYLYQQAGLPAYAIVEYVNVLKIDPQNETAHKALDIMGINKEVLFNKLKEITVF